MWNTLHICSCIKLLCTYTCIQITVDFLCLLLCINISILVHLYPKSVIAVAFVYCHLTTQADKEINLYHCHNYITCRSRLCTGVKTERFCGKQRGCRVGGALWASKEVLLFKASRAACMCYYSSSNCMQSTLIWCITVGELVFSLLRLPWRRDRSSPGGWQYSRPQGASGLYHWAMNSMWEKKKTESKHLSVTRLLIQVQPQD